MPSVARSALNSKLLCVTLWILVRDYIIAANYVSRDGVGFNSDTDSNVGSVLGWPDAGGADRMLHTA